MALIKTAYDLSGGDTRSSVISAATSLSIQPFLTTVAGRVSYFLERRNSDSGEWVQVNDDRGNPIIFHTNNSTEEASDIQGLNDGIEYSVNIKPGDSTTGTLNLDAITDGTIA